MILYFFCGRKTEPVFHLVAVYAAGLPLGVWTVVLTTLVLGGWWILFKVKFGKWQIAFILFFAFFIGVALMPSVQQVSVHVRRPMPQNYVRQLTLAIINYENGRGAFPPAYKTDDTGKPVHSWRVLILPNIEQSALHRKYDFDEPWDGPNNIKLLDQMPQIYACCTKDSPANSTPYKLVVDKGTPFEGGQTIGYGDILDGSSNTFAVVEDLRNPVPWTKPEDLTIEQAVALLAHRKRSDTSRVSHSMFTSTISGPAVSLVDGSTHSVRPHVNPDVIRNYCIRNDGQVVDIDMFRGPLRVARWNCYIALVVYSILLMVPGLVALKRTLSSRFQNS